MLHFILGGAGCGKSTRLTEEIRRAQANGLPVFALVPEQFSFTFDTHLYQSLGAKAFNELESLSFTSLARLLFRTYGGRSGQYADTLTKTTLLHQAITTLLSQNALHHYVRQAKKPGFPEEVSKVITELRRADLTPEQLMTRTALLDGRLRDKAMDLAQIYALYDQSLRARNLKDTLTDISEAAALAAQHDFFRGAAVMIDEFESFTGDQLIMLDTILAQAQAVYLTLRTEEPDAPAFSVFDAANATFRRISMLARNHHLQTDTVLCETPHRFAHADLAHLSKHILRTGQAACGDASHIRITEAKSPYAETDYACAEIRRLHADGVAFRDIAIVTHQLSDYAGTLEAACQRYAIPYNLSLNRGIQHTTVMQLVNAVLELIAAAKPQTEAVLRYAKTRLLGLPCEAVAKLESYCYTWNVEEAMWLAPFTVDLAPNGDPEPLRALLIEPIQQLRKRCVHASGQEICRALYEFLMQMEIPRNTSGLAKDFRDRGCPEEANLLKRLWEQLMQILDTLSATIGEAPLSPTQFRNLFRALISQITLGEPPQLLDAVLIAAAETARLDEPRYVFVLGTNEGCFPSDIHTSGLLTDNDKRMLAEHDMPLSRTAEQLVGDERLIAYKTLSAASEGLYLLYPLADESGASRMPSALLRQVYAMFPGLSRDYAEHADPLFYAATPKAAYDRLVQGYDRDTTEQASVRTALADDPVFGPRLAALEDFQPNRTYHIQQPSLLHAAFSDTLRLSATRVEEYMLCPFSYYLKNGLQIYGEQKKEINHLETGNLVHYCLQQLFLACPTQESFQALTLEAITAMVRQYAADYQETALGGAFGKTPRFLRNYARITDGIPQLVQHLQAELRQSRFTPSDVELVLSEKSDAKPIRLTAPNGVELILNGKIDRVDLFTDQGKRYVRVIDYKTGSKVLELGNLLYGIDMQMLLYLFSITEPGGKYPGAVPAGVLYTPASPPVCSAQRNRDDLAGVGAYQDGHYRMNGILLRDRQVLQAMEENLSGVYIPVKLDKSDSGSGEPVLTPKSLCSLSEAQFRRLRKHAYSLLTDMVQRLYSGDIAANPLQRKDKTPCSYCDYAEICGNVPNTACRCAAETASDDMLQLLTEEVDSHA